MGKASSPWPSKFAVVLALAVASMQLRGAAQASPNSGPSLVVGYLASWKVRPDGPRITDIPAGQLTHIIYAFGEVSSEGLARLADPCTDAGLCDASETSGSIGGNFADVAQLKRSNSHLRVLISLGGWTGSKYFSKAAATADARERFAQSVVNVFFRPYPGLFDGVDIDWEFPVAGGRLGNLNEPSDRANFTLLIAELRRKLSQVSAAGGRRLELTVAVSADPEKIGNLEAGPLAKQLDWMNLMAYDYYTGLNVAGFNAPLFAGAGDPDPNLNVDASTKALVRAGVPPDKVVLGLPFYGRAVAGVPAKNNGLFQRGSSEGSKEWGGADGIDYRDLVARRPEEHGFRQYWSPEARVPWLYNPKEKIWISYDDPASVAQKVSYAHAHGLAGVMIWDLLADDGSLLAAIRRSAPRMPN